LCFWWSPSIFTSKLICMEFLKVFGIQIKSR
jgi:hypothetical protein